MNIFGIILSSIDLWLLSIAGGLSIIFIQHRLATSKESQSAFLDASTKLREAFSSALARLENARLHGSTHDVPDVDGLLQSHFEKHSAAVEEFRQFVSIFRRHGYKKAWQQYCEIAHVATVEAVFMASTINDESPYFNLEQLIHGILRYAKP